MEPVLEVSEVRKQFGRKLALDGVSFGIEGGRIVSLLGPNGAGKTTLLKLICGLLRPTSGTLKICGTDVVENPLAAKRNLTYIPDHPDLYERLTGWEYLSFVASVYGLDRRNWRSKAQELLAHFGLDGEAGALIGTYSHGMRQRLCFAAALLPQPKLVLIDEPWVGLDPRHLRRAVEALAQAAGAGAAVLLSTHSLALAEQIGGRVIILHQGKIRWDGPQEKLLGQRERLEEVFLRLTEDEAG